jgi:hypothetical protein
MAVVPSFDNIRRQRARLMAAAEAAASGSEAGERAYGEIVGRWCPWCSAGLMLIETSLGPRFICQDNACSYIEPANMVTSGSQLPAYAPRFYPRSVAPANSKKAR